MHDLLNVNKIIKQTYIAIVCLVFLLFRSIVRPQITFIGQGTTNYKKHNICVNYMKT
jgi:hypothetical protein